MLIDGRINGYAGGTPRNIAAFVSEGKLKAEDRPVDLHIRPITAFSRPVWLVDRVRPFERIRGLPAASVLW